LDLYQQTLLVKMAEAVPDELDRRRVNSVQLKTAFGKPCSLQVATSSSQVVVLLPVLRAPDLLIRGKHG
jgi:hypothetical protein